MLISTAIAIGAGSALTVPPQPPIVEQSFTISPGHGSTVYSIATIDSVPVRDLAKIEVWSQGFTYSNINDSIYIQVTNEAGTWQTGSIYIRSRISEAYTTVSTGFDFQASASGDQQQGYFELVDLDTEGPIGYQVSSRTPGNPSNPSVVFGMSTIALKPTAFRYYRTSGNFTGGTILARGFR